MIYSVKAVRNAVQQIRDTTPMSKQDEVEKQVYHSLANRGVALEWSA